MPWNIAHKMDWFLDQDRMTAITVPRPTPPVKTFEPTKELPDWANNPVELMTIISRIRAKMDADGMDLIFLFFIMFRLIYKTWSQSKWQPLIRLLPR